MFFATGLPGWQRAAADANPAATVQSQDLTVEEELQMLQTQADAAAATLDHIRQQINQIAAKSDAPAAGQ